MKNCPKNGLTLVEMLIVVAIVMVLVSMTIGIAARFDNQGKRRLTQNTIALLNMALKQFADYGYQYRTGIMINTTTLGGQAERDFYEDLDFPPDCNGYDIDEFRVELAKLQDLINPAGVVIFPDTVVYDPAYSGCAAAYFFLSQVPQCRASLERIDSSLLTDKDTNGQRMQLLVNSEPYSLTRIVDPWGETLRYDYYDETELFWDPVHSVEAREETKRNFPVITSAGPDGKFDTHDDITGIY